VLLRPEEANAERAKFGIAPVEPEAISGYTAAAPAAQK
jgi:hypothetical protein